MEAFLISTGIVALAEIGDKTQLLALMLAGRYRKPVPIVFGIFGATLLNHFAAAAVGHWLMSKIGPDLMRGGLGLSFLAMAGWMLIPDKLDEGEIVMPKRQMGVFATTVFAFFLAEMGDKTQVVTIALAARFHDFLPVVAGTTLGMMLANAPVVWLGDKLVKRVPIRLVHVVSAVVFLVLGVLARFMPGAGVLA